MNAGPLFCRVQELRKMCGRAKFSESIKAGKLRSSRARARVKACENSG